MNGRLVRYNDTMKANERETLYDPAIVYDKDAAARSKPHNM